jgi:hypothetical protein
MACNVRDSKYTPMQHNDLGMICQQSRDMEQTDFERSAALRFRRLWQLAASCYGPMGMYAIVTIWGFQDLVALILAG